MVIVMKLCIFFFISVEYTKKEGITPLCITDAFAGYMSKK